MTPESDHPTTAPPARAEAPAELRRLRDGHAWARAEHPPAAAAAAAAPLRAGPSDYARELEAQNHALRETQKLLEESRARYADLYDYAPVGYCTLDAGGRIEEINLAGVALLGTGVARDQLLRTLLVRSVAARDRAAFVQHLAQCRHAGVATTELELAPRRGELRAVQLVTTRIGPPRGVVVADEPDAPRAARGFRLVLTDVTDRRRAEHERAQLLAREQAARAAAEAANRARDRFLATLSHELRSPLAALLMWEHVLRTADARDEPTRRRALDAIRQSAQAQSRLIDDLLDVSRSLAGKLRIERRSVDLAAEARAALDAIGPDAEARGVRLMSAIDPAAGRVTGDAARLRQVVSNLLANAVKFTPAGGVARLSVARAGRRVVLRVDDTGVGIDPEFLPHVFTPFAQAAGVQPASSTASASAAASATSGGTQGGGLGLGLAIVRELVERHGGTVSAASPGRGRGATFTVTLPLSGTAVVRAAAASTARPSAAAPPARAPRRSLARVRVLVVDDEADVREGLARVLARAGAEVTAAASVREALAAFERAVPDVVVSDIGMHPEDGYALVRAVRARSAANGGGVPAVALTAYARGEDRVEAHAAGFDRHLAKPVAPERLVAVLARLAAQHPRPARTARRANGRASGR